SAKEAETFLGSDFDVTCSTTEISGGARKYFGEKPLFYGGAGLDLIMAKFEEGLAGLSGGESASGIGLFADAGVLFPLNDSFKIGADLRYSMANAGLDDGDVAAGGLAYSLVLCLSR
ncbi:MAG: hypothetical protein KC488_10690, partial [Candidatus Cloacimonetes bacterium]|nr:hypothetical protein [Candidatus Cloacimonadota bacterium]